MSRIVLTALFLLALAGVAVGCGAKDALVLEEGEEVEIGGIEYNVVLTRYLNPEDREDQAYLIGKDPPEKDEKYLATFVQVHNTLDEPASPLQDFFVNDSRGNEYEPLETDSPFRYPKTVELEAKGEANSQLPLSNGPAATGPISGSMILFLIDAESNENRPLELNLPRGEGEEPAKFELDI
ncbi:MAG: hypothetical protein ACR2NA_07785 [Solirubrobacterales bacterium]